MKRHSWILNSVVLKLRFVVKAQKFDLMSAQPIFNATRASGWQLWSSILSSCIIKVEPQLFSSP